MTTVPSSPEPLPPPPPPGKVTYGSYLRIPDLLELQHRLSKPPHHDELLFIISHQVYELWFKQMLHELDEIGTRLDADQPLRAAPLFTRVHRIQHLLIEQIPLLETMFAVDFAAFRDNLRPASGFQSVQFRKVEFMCGAKNPRMMALAGDDPKIKAELESYLRRPTIYDHFLRHLARQGFAIPREVLERDTSQMHEASNGVTDAIEDLYKRHLEFYPQYMIAEALIDIEERFGIWRFHHVKMVERMIGGLGGTGGSSGAKYLAGTLSIKLFPELWNVRDRLGGGYGGH
jgi:tryptophan 2,3-dioxygenase